MRASRTDRDGFILFSVIWIAGLLSVIAATFAISTRLHIKSQANLALSYQAEVKADGIAKLIGYRLADMRLTDNAPFLPMNGTIVSCDLADTAEAAISLQDQAGLIDLNQTSPAALRTSLNRLGIAQAEVIANALIDYRDDNTTVFEGNGDETSLVAGGPGPKNAAFQSVDEIAQAVPEDLVDLSQLSSLFTVYSLQGGIDPAVAPVRLKALLGAATPSPESNEGVPTAALSPRKVFAIEVQVKLVSGVTFRRLAIVALLRLPERPFAVLEWRQVESLRSDKGATVLNISCNALGAN